MHVCGGVCAVRGLWFTCCACMCVGVFNSIADFEGEVLGNNCFADRKLSLARPLSFLAHAGLQCEGFQAQPDKSK